MQKLKNKISSSDLSQSEIDAEFERIFTENEAKFPTTSPIIRFSKFKREIYEITSREVRNDCIYASAIYIGEVDSIDLDPPENGG